MKKRYSKSTIICLAALFTGCNVSILQAAVENSNNTDKASTDSVVIDQIQTDQGAAQGTSGDSGVVGASVINMDAIYPIRLSEPPALHVDRIASYVGNKITITANHYNSGPDNAVLANWQIFDAENVEVLNQEGLHQFEWTPNTAGVFTVKHTISDSNVELSVSEALYILDSITQETDVVDRFWTMEERLLGVWSGKINSPRGSMENVSVVFYNDGSYALSRIMRADIGVPMPYPTEPPYIPIPPNPMMSPSFPPGVSGGGGGFGMGSSYDMSHGHVDHGYTEPFPYRPLDMPSNTISFNKENGIYELLDIWANGEALGNLHSDFNGPMIPENMSRIRFNSDFSMLFFELTNDPFFVGNTQTYVLSRISDVATPPSLDIVKEKIVGEWKGSAVTPWAAPYEVSFNFGANGMYQAISSSETFLHDGEPLGRVSALYFGAVDPMLEEIIYNLDSFVEGKASGDISVELKNGDIVTGTISDVEMSIDYSVLLFTFKHYGKYGPMRYILERQ